MMLRTVEMVIRDEVARVVTIEQIEKKSTRSLLEATDLANDLDLALQAAGIRREALLRIATENSVITAEPQTEAAVRTREIDEVAVVIVTTTKMTDEWDEEVLKIWPTGETRSQL